MTQGFILTCESITGIKSIDVSTIKNLIKNKKELITIFYHEKPKDTDTLLFKEIGLQTIIQRDYDHERTKSWFIGQTSGVQTIKFDCKTLKNKHVVNCFVFSGNVISCLSDVQNYKIKFLYGFNEKWISFENNFESNLGSISTDVANDVILSYNSNHCARVTNPQEFIIILQEIIKSISRNKCSEYNNVDFDDVLDNFSICYPDQYELSENNKYLELIDVMDNFKFNQKTKDVVKNVNDILELIKQQPSFIKLILSKTLRTLKCIKIIIDRLCM